MSRTVGSSSHSRVSPTVTSRRANTMALPCTDACAARNAAERPAGRRVVHASAWAPNTDTPRARSTSSIDAVQRGFTSIGCITPTVVDEVHAADAHQAERAAAASCAIASACRASPGQHGGSTAGCRNSGTRSRRTPRRRRAARVVPSTTARPPRGHEHDRPGVPGDVTSARSGHAARRGPRQRRTPRAAARAHGFSSQAPAAGRERPA